MSEKEQILAEHGRICFATGHVIPEGETIHFDHIKAFANRGLSELNNIAPMCEVHNKAKGTLSLNDFRVKLRLEEFFAGGDNQTLKHLLNFFKEKKAIKLFGQQITYKENENTIRIETLSGENHQYALYRCPTTGWKYFYATLPVELLDSDDEEDHQIGLQPRYLIQDKVFTLYRHFQQHPVLQPSIGRIHSNRIVLFDGQHKAAALLWNGLQKFECKIYLTADLKLLNQTNIAAHDKFAQTRFYTSIMVQKLGNEFGNDFERYRNLENGNKKSEEDFMRFLQRENSQLSGAERNERFRSYLYNSILQEPSNRLADFVSSANRSKAETPLTLDTLKKSLFAHFVYTQPTDDDLATTSYRRDKEIVNNVTLMNMLYDLALVSWNPKAGDNDSNQIKLKRLFGSKSMMAWSELLHGAICGKLELQDAEDRERPFYRDFQENDLITIRKVIERLVNWKRWSDPANSEIDQVISDNKSRLKNWFKDRGLTTGYLGGAGE